MIDARVRPRWWLELGLVAALYVAYERSRAAVPTHAAAALRHARDLVGVERAMHINVERSLNSWLAHHNALGALSGYYYETIHFTVTIAILLWLYARHPDVYRRGRTILVSASFGALLVFWFFPVAPPRLGEGGLTDIVVVHNTFGVAGDAGGGFVNLYAALPSLHVGWAVWVAMAFIKAEPQWRYRQLAWLYPLATTLVVVSTANHFVIDAVGGVAVMAVAAGGTWLLRYRAQPLAFTLSAHLPHRSPGR